MSTAVEDNFAHGEEEVRPYFRKGAEQPAQPPTCVAWQSNCLLKGPPKQSEMSDLVENLLASETNVIQMYAILQPLASPTSALRGGTQLGCRFG